MVDESNRRQPPDADAAFGEPLGRALQVFGDTALNARLEAAEKAWTMAGCPEGNDRHNRMVELYFSGSALPELPIVEALGASHSARNQEFVQRLRMGDLVASWCSDPILGTWHTWRPEAWDHLSIWTKPSRLVDVPLVAERLGRGRHYHNVRIRAVSPAFSSQDPAEAPSAAERPGLAVSAAQAAPETSVVSKKRLAEIKEILIKKGRSNPEWRKEQYLAEAKAIEPRLRDSHFRKVIWSGLTDEFPELKKPGRRGAPDG